ncbi:sulfatase-like hydrolase/transferase [Taibaiella soli]|uniref:Sulfatase N-terminal domain-containing protein n=1 Tax=Taibaiella soli TaxID=1649169 RepID=A0A2W2B9Y6_9BACT|nr:sulfatase-like hydrolase/transferase [Taibaiella soli]PZF73049.1 hypothetical protein DN068_09250 [Taibaiella soli]
MPQIIKTRSIFIFLVPIFYVIRLYRRYWGYVKWDAALEMTCVYLLITFVVFAITQALLGSRKKAAVLCLSASAFFYFWSAWQGFFIRTEEHFSGKLFLAMAAALAVIVLISLIFNRLEEKKQQRTVYFLNLLFIVYLLFEVGLIIKRSSDPKKEDKLSSLVNNTSLNTVTTKPDVYLIVFDEYMGTRGLQQALNYDNSYVDSFLKQHGFSVQTNSRSNYDLTLYSTASLLNTSYFPVTNARRAVGVPNLHESFVRIYNNRLQDVFTEHGYQIRNYSMFDMKDGHALQYSQAEFFPYNISLLTENTFYDVVLRRYRLSTKGGKLHFAPGVHYFQSYRYNEQLAKDLIADAAVKASRPSFYYVHFYTPHEPFYFNKNGRLLSADSALYVSDHSVPEFYTYNLQYASRKMFEVVKAIQNCKKSNAIIVVLGDHGYRNNNLTLNSPLRCANLNAIYFPDQDYRALYDSITSVNAVRTVMNKALGTQYQLLPDSSQLLVQDPTDKMLQ